MVLKQVSVCPVRARFIESTMGAGASLAFIKTAVPQASEEELKVLLKSVPRELRDKISLAAG
eukprot:7417110-Karenia_brevis.AAC.1